MSEAFPGPTESVVAISEPAPAEVEHLVGNVQHLLNVLGVKNPRAACGELLVLDPDAPDLTNAPLCPRCIAAKPHWLAAQ